MAAPLSGPSQIMHAPKLLSPSRAVGVFLLAVTLASAAEVSVRIDTPMEAPRWAVLQRQLLAEQTAPAREFFEKYYDDRGYLQAFIRWGANDGPDDAFENFNRWPELHALGGHDDILTIYLRAQEGMIRQYTEARTVEVPFGREGMYYRDFSAMSDWMHHGEASQIHNRMGLSVPTDPKFQERARRFAGFYMGEDPEAPNYDPEKKLIRSMMNGSRGPLLRKATAMEWVGDPFDPTGFVLLHNERNFQEFLDHYAEYTDVVGDGFLNLVATTLPMTAYLATGDGKYRQWLMEYMDAWLERMKANNGVIPSYVALDGTIGGPEGKWWGNAYGWGFSPINTVDGIPQNRNRIHRSITGFANAVIATGDLKYADAWRNMINSVNSNARRVDGETQYPTMYGADGWYGWQRQPWSVGAMDLWFWTMRADDRERVANNPWVSFLHGGNPEYPVTALERDLATLRRRAEALRADATPPEKRLADNMLALNPVTNGSLIQLMIGGLPPGVDGALLNSRIRYFDPVRQRAGIPEDVASLVSEMTSDRTVVTLVNLHPTEARTLILQAGAYGEHDLSTVRIGRQEMPVGGPLLRVELAPGSGQTLTLSMQRYANAPSLIQPWDRR